MEDAFDCEETYTSCCGKYELDGGGRLSVQVRYSMVLCVHDTVWRTSRAWTVPDQAQQLFLHLLQLVWWQKNETLFLEIGLKRKFY